MINLTLISADFQSYYSTGLQIIMTSFQDFSQTILKEVVSTLAFYSFSSYSSLIEKSFIQRAYMSSTVFLPLIVAVYVSQKLHEICGSSSALTVDLCMNHNIMYKRLL